MACGLGQDQSKHSTVPIKKTWVVKLNVKVAQWKISGTSTRVQKKILWKKYSKEAVPYIAWHFSNNTKEMLKLKLMGQLLIYSFNLFNHLGKYQTKIDVFRLVKKLQFIDIENLEHKYYLTVLLRHWHQNLLHYIQAVKQKWTASCKHLSFNINGLKLISTTPYC